LIPYTGERERERERVRESERERERERESSQISRFKPDVESLAIVNMRTHCKSTLVTLNNTTAKEEKS
jgi:hypothetical protein